MQVYRFSSGSWLEDRDFWRMSGLFRSELFTKPELHLEDVFVKQDFAPDFSSATVTFDCKVSGAGTVSVVFNGQEQSAEVGSLPNTTAAWCSARARLPGCGRGRAGCFFHLCGDPALWSARQPNLYETEIALLREGALMERTGLKVGLRRFELKDRQMLLNGKRIVFQGVNRHEWSCTGRTVSREEMLWDVKNLKAHNVNAVRPATTRMTPISCPCAMNMACMSSGRPIWRPTAHGRSWVRTARTSGRCPVPARSGGKMCWPRAEAMLERDKNHPAILIWSCGNESHGGKTCGR